MSFTTDLDYIIEDLKKGQAAGAMKTKPSTVRGVTSVSVIRHSVASGQSTKCTTVKRRGAPAAPSGLSPNQLEILEGKAAAALRVIQKASASFDEVLQQTTVSMASSSSPVPPRRTTSDITSFSSPRMKKKKKTRTEDKAEGKTRWKSKSKSPPGSVEKAIFKEGKDWIQGIEVRRPSKKVTSTVTLSYVQDERRGSKDIDDIVVDNQGSIIKPKSRVERLETVSDRDSSGRGGHSTKISRSHRQLSVKSDAVTGKLDSAIYISQGVQTSDDSDSTDSRDEIKMVRKEIADLKKENEDLRRQLDETVEWEVQVMKAYKTMAEKHHQDSRGTTVKGSKHPEKDTLQTSLKSAQEVPSRQMRPSSVTNHADFNQDHELHKAPETTVNIVDPAGNNHDGTRPVANDDKTNTIELSKPSTEIITKNDKDEDVTNVMTTNNRLKQNFMMSRSYSVGNKMTSPCSPVSRKRAISVTTPKQTVNKDRNSGYSVVSARRVTLDVEQNSDGSSIYEQFEISGDRHDMRFPWQHDVPVQCDLVETREVSIQTEFEPCSQCQLRRLSTASDMSDLDSASNYGVYMGLKRGSAASSSRKSSTRGKKLHRQNFSLDLSDYPGSPNGGGLMVNGAAAPGSPTGQFRHRSSRLSVTRPLSDSDISRSSMESFLGHSKIFQRRKGTIDVATSKSGITLTIDRCDSDSLPCSPNPSPLPQELDSSSYFRQKPKVIVTHHDDPDDVSLGRSSSNGSQDSTTSDSSSLRVPSPEFLQTKAIFNKERSVTSSSDLEDDEPSARPPNSRIHQRRGAVISQVPPSSSDIVDDDGGGSSVSCLQETGPGGTNSPPHHGDSLFPPTLGYEHRCSIMSTASSTLATVAAVHLQDYIEASATAGFDSNGFNHDNNDGAETKKKLHALFKKKFGKDKDKSMIDDITTVFANFKIRDQEDLEFATYKDKHWRDVIMEVDNNNTTNHIPYSPSVEEIKRRDKVWELFRSECVYLIEHILVLKNVFQEPLRAMQCEGHLMYIEPAKIFANLDELSQVSASFCRDLIRMLLTKASRTEFCHTDAVVTAFALFGNRVCPAYQRYCMNYSGALHYIETLKKHEDFNEFVKLCEQDTRCKRLQLADLLVAPIQHVTKYPLLLKDIRERTEDPTERASLNLTLQAVEVALNELDGKVKWLSNFERLRELQQMITWPPAEEMDSKVAIPEFLKDMVSKMSKSNLLASTKRTLLNEGPLTMIDGTKSSDMYVFLFDDMLLISKIRKNTMKKKSIPDGMGIMATPPVPRKKDGFSFVVYRPPIPLDRVSVIEIESKRAAASGLKHGFVLLQNSRYQQFVGAYTLTAADESSKQTWLTHMKNARDKWIHMLRSDEGDDFGNDDIKRDRKRTL